MEKKKDKLLEEVSKLLSEYEDETGRVVTCYIDDTKENYDPFWYEFNGKGFTNLSEENVKLKVKKKKKW